MALILGKKKKDKPKNKIQELLKNQKIEMIQGIDELADTTVKEIMIPRIDTIYISADASKDDIASTLRDNGFSRYPVYEETIDNVIGVLYVKDILKVVLDNQDIDVRKLMRKPYFIPESKKIDSLLAEFKRKRVHIAVAVDEYGGVSGIVSLEDIIEEIVGDIQDEFDNEDEDVLVVSSNIFLCDARLNIEEFNEQVGSSLPLDDFDTLGGFVFDLFGKIPVKYEKISWKNLDFIIHEMDTHKLKTIKIVKRKSEAEDEK